VTDPRPWWAIIGSLVFFVLAPGTIVGLVPFWLTGWHVGPPLFGLPGLQAAGVILLLLGLASLVESFMRFATIGLGTPAPVAPPTRLVVSGQYSYVRNPIYVAILVMLVGQSTILGSTVLLQYALLVWGFFHAWVLIYEEPTLATQFGPSYEAYRQNVRRWWPRVRPWSG
jgi:protein-S-isoprenylcysteine O-methyltransferase Ste14